MRAAMAQGFQDSMKFMKESGMSEKEAMHMMIMTQYLDTLKEFASLFANERDRFIGHFSDRPAVVSHEASSHGSIVVPHGPSAVKDLEHQIREGFLQLEVTIGRDEHGMGNIGQLVTPQCLMLFLPNRSFLEGFEGEMGKIMKNKEHIDDHISCFQGVANGHLHTTYRSPLGTPWKR